MTTTSSWPVVLRSGVVINDPLNVVLGILARWRLDLNGPSQPTSFGEPDLRLANRGGARISAAQIAAILERRDAIELALPLRQLFDAFAGIHGVGFAKMTKALHPKRPALIPMLDSIVQKYLRDDDPGAQTSFGQRAITLTRCYKNDLDRNITAVRALRQELVRRGYELTEVRILDLLILSAAESFSAPAFRRE